MFSRIAMDSAFETRACTFGNLKIPKCKLKVSEGNIAIRGARYFNGLCVDLEHEQDINKFKKGLKAIYDK